MVAAVDVCNLGLVKIGTDPIASLDDNKKAAKLCKRIYERGPLVCASCGAEIEVIAVITAHAAMKAIDLVIIIVSMVGNRGNERVVRCLQNQRRQRRSMFALGGRRISQRKLLSPCAAIAADVTCFDRSGSQ